MDSTIEPLFVADEAIPAVQDGRRSRRPWVTGSLVAAVLLSTAIGGAGVAFGLKAQGSADTSTRTLQELETRMVSLEGASPASATEVQALSNRQKASDVDLAAAGTELKDTAARLSKTEARLKDICDKTAVSNQVSTINGQMAATDNPNYMYYSNLTEILHAVCGVPDFHGED